MNSELWILTCSFVILLAFEIRYRLMREELEKLKDIIIGNEGEILKIKQELKLKKNVFEDSKPA